LNFTQYLEADYTALVQAANKITGNNELSHDLLHYSIEELSGKENIQGILDSGGARFYLIRIMMTQWRSQTGPFHRQFKKHHEELEWHDKPDKEDKPLDLERVNEILDSLEWYDKELFRLYADGEHNYSTLSKETGIPRTSIALTIKRVRNHIKRNLD
jgi:RNA polymerase sigma factor (sigma-70 family)